MCLILETWRYSYEAPVKKIWVNKMRHRKNMGKQNTWIQQTWKHNQNKSKYNENIYIFHITHCTNPCLIIAVTSQFNQADSKENTKSPASLCLIVEHHGDQWIPLTLMWKVFPCHDIIMAYFMGYSVRSLELLSSVWSRIASRPARTSVVPEGGNQDR